MQLTRLHLHSAKLKTLLLLLALLLTACEAASGQAASTPAATTTPKSATLQPANPPTAPPADSPTRQPTASPPPRGGIASLGLVGQPDSLNPITNDSSAVRELSPLLFDTLLQVDPSTAQLQPGLAESWAYSDDGKQVTFHLPPRLKWSDGRPLTAAAIVASLKATEHPALLAFSELAAPDAQTLKLTFARIDCAAVTTLAQLPLLPAADVLEPVPPGSGPFKVANWSEDKRTLSLERNPTYHGPAPLLDGLTVRFIHNNEVAVALSEGQFDALGPIQSKIQNPKAKSFTDLAYPAPQVIYLAVNFEPKNVDPLPPEVRQALLLALDRETMLGEALGGDGQLLAGSLLPGHWAADPGLTWPAYDPPAAKALLAKAGLKDEDGDGWLDQDGQRLELSIRVNGENTLQQNLGWLAASYYRDLGLFVRADMIAFTGLVDDLFTHDFSLAMFSWPLLADPDQRLYWRSTENKVGLGLNFVSYDNLALDKLLDRAVAVPGCDMSQRAKIYKDIQQTLAADRPVDFLLAPNRHVLVAGRLHGLKPGPFVLLTWNVAEWYLQDGNK